MEMRVAKEKILMSDTLKGNVPDLEDDDDVIRERMIEELSTKYVHVIIDLAGDKVMTGLLESVLFGEPAEIEFKTELHEALSLAAIPVNVNNVEMQHGESSKFEIRGQRKITASRIFDINPQQQTCMLMLQLTKIEHEPHI